MTSPRTVAGAAQAPPGESPLIVIEPAPRPGRNPEGNAASGAPTAATETACADESGKPSTPSVSGPGQIDCVCVTGSAWGVLALGALVLWARLIGAGRWVTPRASPRPTATSATAR